jgi:hypothetical protein
LGGEAVCFGYRGEAAAGCEVVEDGLADAVGDAALAVASFAFVGGVGVGAGSACAA